MRQRKYSKRSRPSGHVRFLYGLFKAGGGSRAIEESDYSHFFPVAFLISVAAFFASASFAKPMTAEYLLPTACATKKLRSATASPIVRAILCARPGLLSPSMRSVFGAEAEALFLWRQMSTFSQRLDRLQ
jgi:hypothetical protein